MLFGHFAQALLFERRFILTAARRVSFAAARLLDDNRHAHVAPRHFAANFAQDFHVVGLRQRVAQVFALGRILDVQLVAFESNRPRAFERDDEKRLATIVERLLDEFDGTVALRARVGD